MKLIGASRGAAVETGRRPPPEAARSGLDGGEHGARMTRPGRPLVPGLACLPMVGAADINLISGSAVAGRDPHRACLAAQARGGWDHSVLRAGKAQGG